MFLQVGELQINYEVYGQGPRLLLLHGWGLDLGSFDSVVPALAQKFQVIRLDLPGFGLSSALPETFDILDYAQIVEKFLETLEIKQTAILGHSFGGAVSIHLASFSNRISKLILESSAGLYPKNLFVRLKVFFYKSLKKSISPNYLEKLQKILGSVDYKNSGPLRKSLIKVVNSNVLSLLPRIQVPTLIIWGDQDELTTAAEAQILNKGIRDSSIVFLNDCGHFPHLERPREFIKAVCDFLEPAGGPANFSVNLR